VKAASEGRGLEDIAQAEEKEEEEEQERTEVFEIVIDLLFSLPSPYNSFLLLALSLIPPLLSLPQSRE
jgi:hypothetical protein